MTNSYDAAGNPLPSYLDPAGNPLPAYPTGPTADQLPPPPIPSNTGLANYGFDMSQVLGEDQQLAQQMAQDAAPVAAPATNPLPALPLGGLALPYDTNAAAALPISATTPNIPATTPVAAPPVQKEQLHNDLVGNFINWENQHLPGPLSTGINQALENFIPATAGLISGSVATGVAAPTGPVAPLIGLAVGFGASYAAGEGQKAVMKWLLGDQQYAEWENHLAMQLKQDPVSAEVGQIVTVLPYLKAGNPIPALKLAGSLGRQGLSLTRVGELWNAADKHTQQTLINMAFGGGSQVGITAFQQAQAGVFQPVQLAGSVISGVFLNTPTKLGRAVFGQEINPADQRSIDVAAQAVEDGQSKEELQGHYSDAYERGKDLQDQWASLESRKQDLIANGGSSRAIDSYRISQDKIAKQFSDMSVAGSDVFNKAKELGYGELSDKRPKPLPVSEIATSIRQRVDQNPAASAAFQALSPFADVHVVGGAIRDPNSKDIDMTFGGDAHEILAELKRLAASDPSITWKKTGVHFPVYRLTINRGGVKSEVEIALHRDENPVTGKTKFGRQIPIEQDLQRRAETINSAAVNLNKGTLVDPYGAIRDIQKNALHAVHPLAFKSDLSRIMRGIRFMAEGFVATPEYKSLMTEYAPALAKAVEDGTVPGEVIRDQLIKTFSASDAGLRRALNVMQETGVLKAIMPELSNTVGFDQKNPYHDQELFKHLVEVASETAVHSKDPVVRLAAFFHDIGKPATQVINKVKGVQRASYHGHESEGAEIAGKILSRLKFSADMQHEVKWFISNHMFDDKQILGGKGIQANPPRFLRKLEQGAPDLSPEGRNTWVRRRIDGLMAIRQADRLNHKQLDPANPDLGRVDEMRPVLEANMAEPRSEHDLAASPMGRKFGGNDIKEIMGETAENPGREVGASIGAIKAMIVDEVAAGLPNNYETLVERAKQIVSDLHAQAAPPPVEPTIQGRTPAQPNLNPGFLDQIVAHAQRTGAQMRDPKEVTYGWVLPNGTGLEINGNLTHQHSVGGYRNFDALIAGGAIRVAHFGQDLNYQLYSSRNKALETKVLDDILAHRGSRINILAEGDEAGSGARFPPDHEYRFSVDDFKANDFDFQKTLRWSDRISAIQARTLTGTSQFDTVAPDEFERQMTLNKAAGTLSQYSPEELQNMQLYKAKGADIYYALKPNPGGKDFDITSVMNNSELRGKGMSMVMPDAIARGGKTLDAFDVKGFLPDRYKKYGFVETQRSPYDVKAYGEPTQEMKDGWKTQGWQEGDQYPDVVYMHHDPFGAAIEHGRSIEYGRSRPRGYDPEISTAIQGRTQPGEKPGIPPEFAKYLTPEEKAAFRNSTGVAHFVTQSMKMPAVQEFVDIAKLGEGAKNWFQRSHAAVDAVASEAPQYFSESEDKEKFIDLLAAFSPRQQVDRSMVEALAVWKTYVDAGRPSGTELQKLLNQNILSNIKGKEGNAIKALTRQELWPDLSKNRQFKVPSFASNLKGFLDRVTNDGWMAAFAGIGERELSNPSSYHPLSALVRMAAEELGWEPAEAQSAIWAFIRTLTERGETLPEEVRRYSGDFADIIGQDHTVRQMLSEMGVDNEKLDARLRTIAPKPEVTGGAKSTSQDSVWKLVARLEEHGRSIPDRFYDQLNTGETNGIQPKATGPATQARSLSEADQVRLRGKADEARAASAAESAKYATGTEPDSIAATEGTNGPGTATTTATTATAEPAPGTDGYAGEPGITNDATALTAGGSGDASAPRAGDLYPASRGTEPSTSTEPIGPAENAAGTTGNGDAVERGTAADGTAAATGIAGGTSSTATRISETLAPYKDLLDHVTSNGLVRYRFLKIDGLPQHDVTSLPKELRAFLDKNPAFRDALSGLYEHLYITRGEPSAEGLDPATEELAAQAYVLKHGIPEQWKTDAKLVALELLGKAHESPHQMFSRADILNARQGVRAFLDQIDTHGLLKVHFDSKSDLAAEFAGGESPTIAYISSADPYTLHINPTQAAHGTLYNFVAEELANALESRKDFTPVALAQLRENLARQQRATAQDVVSSLSLHEGLHAMVDRVLGLVYNSRPEAAQARGYAPKWTALGLETRQMHNLWEHLPEEVWTELVRGGLANEVEALSVLNTGKSLNEHLTGKIDYRGSQPMDAQKAAYNINEALVHYLSRYYKDPLSYHNGATEETQRRSIHDPEAYEQAAQVIGHWFEDRLRSPEVTDQLAVEARDQSAIRGQLDSGTEAGASTAEPGTEPTTGVRDAAAADQASLDPEHVTRMTIYADQLHDLATQITHLHDAGDDAGAQAVLRDHEELNHFIQTGKSLFTPEALRNVQTADRDAIARRTEDAVQIERQPNETDLQYGEKLAKAAGYDNLDHARQMLNMANSQYFAPIVKAGKVYTQIGGHTYEGSPVDHAIVWDPEFRAAIEGAFGTEVARANAEEPPIPAVGGIHGDQYFEALHEPAPVFSEHPAIQGRTPPKTPEEGHQARKTALKKSEIGKVAQEIHGDNPSFDPVKAEAAAKVGEAEDAKQRAEEAAKEAAEKTPIVLGSDQDFFAQIPGLSYSKQRAEILATARAYRDFGAAYQAGATHADPQITVVANGLNNLVTEMAKGWDFDHISSHPIEWFKQTMYHIRAMQFQVSQIARDLKKYMDATDDPAATNKRIRQTIDAPDEPERQRRMSQLSESERSVAELFHQFYQVSGSLSVRHGLLQAFLENYLPHMIEREEGPNSKPVVAGRNLRKTTYNAIQRVVDHATGDIRYKTIEDLQERLQEAADIIDREEGNPPGTTKPLGVKEDLSSIFEAHGKGMTTALVMREMIDRMSKDLEVVRPGFAGRPVLDTTAGKNEYWKSLPKSMRDQLTTVSKGPLKTILRGYEVWKPLAEVMERLARTDEVTGPFAGTARMMNGLNTVYKQGKFFSSPMHAWSMMSNLSSLTSKLGLFGLPPMFNPTTYRMIGEGGRIENDSARLYKAIQHGIKEYEEPEGLRNSEAWLKKIPVAGHYLRFMHRMMWHEVGYKGQLGLYDFLSKQYTKKYMNDHGQPPNEADADAIGVEAAYQARKALGFLNELDMTKDWDLYGNSMFLALRWTTGQLRTAGDVFGIKSLANIGGGERYGIGSSPETQKMLQDRHLEASRRLLLGGMMRLFMTSMVTGTALSMLFNGGNASTPFQNFSRDPLHTFDIYAGVDPKTNKDRWIHNNTYLFQRELMDYGLAGVKALLDGRNFGDAAMAIPARFEGKANPMTAGLFEQVMGREIGRWMYGYSDPSISGDPSIKNIHQALDKAGVQDFGSLEDRLIYAARQLDPLSPGFPYNPAKANESSRIGDALGIGQYIPTPENAPNLALWGLGSRVNETTPATLNAQGEMQTPGQQASAFNARNAQITQMVDAIKQGDWNTGMGISQQLNLTPGQFKEYVLYGLQDTVDRGILQSTVKPNPGAQQVVNISGKELTPAQQVEFYNIENQRMATVMKAVTQTPQWSKMTKSQMHALTNDWTIFADKLSQEQYGQQIGARPSTGLTGAKADAILGTVSTLEQHVFEDLLKRPDYQNLDPAKQEALITERSSAVKNAVWQQNFGNLKGATSFQIEQMVNVQEAIADQTRAYVPNLNLFKSGTMPYEQQAVLTNALAYAKQVTSDALSQKIRDKTMNRPLQLNEVWPVIKNGLVLQDAALTMLHDSPIYTQSDPATQTNLDITYSNFAHRLVLYDERGGIDLANETDIYHAGFGQSLQSKLMADEQYKQLEDSYPGGKAGLDAHARELAGLKQRFAQERGAPTSRLAQYDNLITQWYYQQHPDYYNFIQTRTQWEERSPLGQLWLALRRDELNFAANSPDASFAANLLAQSA